MKVSVEDAILKRKESEKLTFFQMSYMNYEVMDSYLDMPTEAWVLAAWFYAFYCQPNNTKREGEWLWVSGKAPISRLYPFHIRDTTTVTKLFRWLCEGNPKERDDRPKFLEKKVVRDPEKACGKKILYKPLPMLISLCSNDVDLPRMNSAETKGAEDYTEDDTIPEPEVLSDTLFDFYKLLMQNTSAFKHQRPPTNEKPAKLWLNTDRYIKQLMDGTFYEKNKDKFDEKAEDRGAIPKLTLTQIVELCKSVKVYSANGKPSIENVFMQWDGKVYKSPLLNYVWASMPPELPKYTAEQIAKLKAKYPNLYEQVTESSLRVAKIEKDDPYMYLLYNKMMDYFDDDALVRMGKFSGRTPTKRDLTYLPYWCIMAYNSYRDKAKKNPKWSTFESWMREFKVDDRRTYTPWFWMLYWIRKNSNGKYMLTEDSQVRSEIEKRIAKPYGNGQED